MSNGKEQHIGMLGQPLVTGHFDGFVQMHVRIGSLRQARHVATAGTVLPTASPSLVEIATDEDGNELSLHDRFENL